MLSVVFSCRFDEQGKEFLIWLEEQVEKCRGSLDASRSLRSVLIAHNGMKFDFLLLGHEIRRHNLPTSALEEFTLWDTLVYFRERGHKVCKLGVLFEEKFKKPLDNAHDATVDVSALADLTLRATNDYAAPSADGASFMPVAAAEVAPVLEHVDEKGVCAISSVFFHDQAAQVVEDLERWTASGSKSDRRLTVLSASPQTVPADGGVKVNFLIENLEATGKDQILALIRADPKSKARPGKGDFQGIRLKVLDVRKYSLQQGEGAGDEAPSFTW